jgi:hypothetical protein
MIGRIGPKISSDMTGVSRGISKIIVGAMKLHGIKKTRKILPQAPIRKHNKCNPLKYFQSQTMMVHKINQYVKFRETH